MVAQFLTVGIRWQLLVVLGFILVTSRFDCKAAAGGDPATVGLGEMMERDSEYTRVLARHILQDAQPQDPQPQDPQPSSDTTDVYGDVDVDYAYDYPAEAISETVGTRPPPPPPRPPPVATFDPPRAPEELIAESPSPELQPVPSLGPQTTPNEIPDGGELPALAKSSQSGNVDEVEKLLKRGGMDVDAQFAALNNRSALHLAAEQNHIEVVQLLIDNGATVDSRDADQNTPLHLALQGQAYLEVIEALLIAGGNVSLSNSAESMPLHMAMAFVPSLGVLEVLIEAGADLDAQDSQGETPLHIGARHGELLAMKHLIDNGANAKIRDRRGYPVSQVICKTSCPASINERLLRSLEKAMVE